MKDRDGVPLEPDRRRYWDERYAGEGDVWGLEPNQSVAGELADLAPGRALDLGAGQGRNAVWLAKQGHTVTAVDLSTVAVARIHELAAAAGVAVDAFVADLSRWEPEPGAYDLVVLAYLQFPPDLRRRVHGVAKSALAPGGVAFLVAHHLENLDHGAGGPQVDELLFTEVQLAEDFAGFQIDQLETVLRPVEDADRPAIDVVMRATKPG